MARSERFWDRVAPRYDAGTDEGEIAELVEVVAKHLAPTDSVLDFGCGTGAVATRIASRVQRVHGIDTSARMIEIARARSSDAEAVNVSFTRRTIFDDALEPASFDVVLALNVLHLLPDAESAVARIAELTTPGGLVVSVTPCVADGGALLRTTLALLGRIRLLPPVRPLTLADAERLVQHGGLDVVESDVREDVAPSSVIVARKPR